MMLNLIESLNKASEQAVENKQDLEFALGQFAEMPEIEKPLSKLLSIISASYLVRLIEIIDKARNRMKGQ